MELMHRVETFERSATDAAAGPNSTSAMQVVREALKEAGLHTAQGDRKVCEDKDVPDAFGRCFWAWSSDAKDAGPHLIRLGFTMIETDWAEIERSALRGDILILPAFNATNMSNTSSSTLLSSSFGFVAIYAGAGLWRSDASYNLGMLSEMQIQSQGMPCLYRLQEDVELSPESDEYFSPLPVKSDILSHKTARKEAWFTL